jgi:hypothetical protein
MWYYTALLYSIESRTKRDAPGARCYYAIVVGLGCLMLMIAMITTTKAYISPNFSQISPLLRMILAYTHLASFVSHRIRGRIFVAGSENLHSQYHHKPLTLKCISIVQFKIQSKNRWYNTVVLYRWYNMAIKQTQP